MPEAGSLENILRTLSRVKCLLGWFNKNEMLFQNILAVVLSSPRPVPGRLAELGQFMQLFAF